MSELIDEYQKRVNTGEIFADEVQVSLIKELQLVFDALTRKSSLLMQLFGQYKKTKGLYFWGGVGIGKTYVMDLFFDALPVKEKKRLHFHKFMYMVQSQLQELQGIKNPLEMVANTISSEAKVLCFDEFFVRDIADAMILERLFNALFTRGITLIATSNIPPDDLYLNGLHRARFLPAIDLIKKHCKVIAVNSIEDYRLRELEKAGIYFMPLGHESELKMRASFDLYSGSGGEYNQSIDIQNRLIAYNAKAKNIIWFDFNVICSPPRSQVDYIEIAKRFDIVMVSNVPKIKERDLTSVTYLIHLVDVFYDSRVKLILSAQDIPEKIYDKGEKQFEFQRTQSRLHEMQSHEYLVSRKGCAED